MAVNRKRVGWTIAFIVILTIASLLFDGHVSSLTEGGQSLAIPQWVPGASFWNKFDFHLGLDLKGGTQLLYQADTSKIDAVDADSAVAGVRDVIERRVNAFGVAEPLVQMNQSQEGNYRIIVELAGVKDVNQAIKMIGETPLLEFKEQNPDYNANQPVTLTAEQQKELDTFNEAARKKAEEINKRALAGEDFVKLAKEFSEDAGSKDKGGDLGWAVQGNFVEEFDKAIFTDLKVGQITPQPVKTQFGYHIIKKMDERQATEAGATATINGTTTPVELNNTEVLSSHILILTKTAKDIVPPVDEWINTQLSGKNLKRASVQYVQNTGEPEVSLEFNDEGAKLFEEITGRNVGKPVAIYLDGQPISVPTVNEK
ncbi:MAG TPA: peptidylprolyl isomerase, partial [Patescibacteria group bacterium]|nr:peptidylprolyl isomerase [Patescibacteria group bacterium]